MDLDARQTRRLFLAGTVAFPTPFPSTGVITFEKGDLEYAAGKQTPMIVVHEHPRRSRASRRVVLQDDVAALFIPGTWKPDGTFRISRKKWVSDFERGEWFLDGDVDPGKVNDRLKKKPPEEKKEKDKNGDNGVLAVRGIIFVPEHRPVMTITEEATTAGGAIECPEYGCTCEWDYGCRGDKWCTCDWY